MTIVANQSFVTLATNDSYSLGALALAQSLRNTNTNRKLTIMITRGVSDNVQSRLKEVFDHVELVNVMDSMDSLNLSLLNRPDLGITFTKLHCWRLIQFSKCVFLDADTLVLKNVDDLFEREEFSASADVGWPDCFNSGVFVYKPSLETYSSLQKFALETGSFDGGDQGLLNSYFSSWSTGDSSRRLPFVYNMTTNVSYSYAPAYKQYKDSVKIVHFIGANKPWKYTFNFNSNTVEGQSAYEGEHLNRWWSVFAHQCLSSIDSQTQSTHLKLIRSTRNTTASAPGYHSTVGDQQCHDSHWQSQATGQSQGHQDSVVIGSDQHKDLWQSGKIEYTGRDSFSNIQAHLDSQLAKK